MEIESTNRYRVRDRDREDIEIDELSQYCCPSEKLRAIDIDG